MQVELEVPQTCSFVLRTADCALSEVALISAQGQPVYKPVAGSDLFQAAMEKNPLNFVVEQVTEVSVFPKEDEPENILNIKRGIISALLSPVMEEEHNKKMPTIHGLCSSELTVNSRKDIDVDVTVERDLSQCSNFSSQNLPTSPLSLTPGLLISSSQTCNYQFDNRKKHMTETQCREKHVFIPFSHEDQYGIVSEVKQSLVLQESSKINNRYFSNEGANPPIPNKQKNPMIPEVREVAEFMEFLLGDCSGDQDQTFLTLRVIGVMGKYMEGFPSLKSSLLRCIRQSDASLSVQKSAVQSFRLMEIDPDVSRALMDQYQDAEAPAEKRIAAYLMLMRNPELVDEVLKTLRDESNLQVKSFVISHISNLMDLTDPDLQTIKDYITRALENDENLSAADFTKFSRNYKVVVPRAGSVQSNVIFDSVNFMPREVMLATTLDAFSAEILEIGLEGEGLEPTIDALFGENGFFPDVISRALYWANDKVPHQKFIYRTISLQVSQNIFNQIKENFGKFGDALKNLEENKDAPKAMAYLRFMGTELGYMKTSELNGMIENIIKYAELFFSTVFRKVSSGTDNELFAHYMFLDKAFTLPTGAGLPLKLSMAGVFAPGASGGLTFDRSMQQLTFRPSAGVEFVTQMGVFLPEFVDAGIQMHTNIYHESGLNAKVTVTGTQVQLSIPTPERNTQLISVSNELLSLTSTMTRKVSPIVEDRTDATECNPFFPGLKYCTIIRYSNASSTNSAPYFPLTGETRFAVELQPTGDVTEYTATLAYELLREGKEGRHKVDSLMFSLKAEGPTPTTATTALKYNRNKNSFTSELQIPDFDVEAAVKVEVTDVTRKGKKIRGISVDVTNKKNLYLSLVGRARVESMDDVELELEMAAPALQMDASTTASLKNTNGLVLEMDTRLNCPDTFSKQEVVFRYDEKKVELEMKSDMNSELAKLLPDMDEYSRQLQTYERAFFSLPLPFPGMTSEHLNLPSEITLPQVQVPYLGLIKPETRLRVPSFTVPFSLDFSVPRLGVAELSAKVKTNFYDWEGSVSGGNYTADVPSYIAKYRVMASSPLSALSHKVEGTALVYGTMDDDFKYLVNGSFNHNFLDASFSASESLTVTESESTEVIEKMKGSAIYKYEVTSPLGLHTSLYYSTQVTSMGFEMAGDSNLDGALKIGPFYANSAYTQSYTANILENRGRGESMLRFDTSFIKGKTVIKGEYLDEKLTIVSKTSAEDDTLMHTGEIMYEDGQLTLKSDLSAEALGKTIHSQSELGLTGEKVSFRIETEANYESNRAFSLLTGALNGNGLEINTDASLTFEESRGMHKGTLTLGLTGLATSCTTTLQCSSMTFENNFNAAVDGTGLRVEGKISDIEASLNSVFKDNFICDGASYNHDIKLNMRPFSASVVSANNLEMFDLSVGKESNIKMEPFKLDATGSITGKYKDEDTVKSTCGISFADLSASIKCDSSADVLDSQVSHNFELDVAGLSSVIKSEMKLKSTTLRVENVIRTMAMPFSLTVDAILNGDGSVRFYGKHTGQLYSKFLLKAEPFAIAESHDWRASATHMLTNGDSAETHVENKFDGLLAPVEQSMLWKFKSKLNNHAYNQDISIYNKEAEMGAEMSGVLLTNLFNKAAESQEFSISSFLKYDKNHDCHIISLPFIESLPAAFEKMKTTVLTLLESFQQYLNGLDVNDLARQFRENLDEVPQMVSDFIEEADLENKFNMAKDKVVSLAQDYAVTLDDLEASMENLKVNLEKILIELATKVNDIKAQIKTFVESGSWAEILTSTRDALMAFDEKYEITRTIVKVISAIEDVIRQIDLQKLQDGSMKWLKELDAKYEIKAKIQEKVSELKEVIETFDMKMLVQDVTDYISSFDLAQYVEQLSDYIPSEDIQKVLESMKDIFLNWIEEYEIVEKINYVYSKLGELFEKYEIQKKMERFLDQAKILIKQYKIRETVEMMAEALKSIPFEYVSDKVLQLLDTTVNHLKSIDIKQTIDDLNDYILKITEMIKNFDYNEFVDEINAGISKVTNYVNEQIKVYEIAEKIEASRTFLREMQASIYNYLEQLKNTKVAEIYRMVKGVMDTTAIKDIKLKIQDTLEDMKQRINDMDIRDEILVYLQRASESYTNIIDFISSHLKSLIEEVQKISQNKEVLDKIQKAVEEVLDFLRVAEIEVEAFTLPFTTLEVPAFQLSLARLQDISLPSKITIPEFAIHINQYILAYVYEIGIDFEMIKNEIIQFIQNIQEFEMPELDPEATFGDLRALYLFNLPDFTFPEIRLVELKFPQINVPKLHLQDFNITMLAVPDLKLPLIQIEPCIPAFGKLYGEFKLKSPYYSVTTTAAIQNTTTKSSDPQFKATLTSQAKSTLQALGYTLDTVLQIETPKMKKMVISETIKVDHMAFSVDHEGSLTLKNPSIEASAKTTVKATTDMYKADFVNNIGLALKNGISLTMDTTCNHNLDVPSMDITAQALMTKTAKAQFESGTISVSIENKANGKWSIKNYKDEGTHKSNMEFSVNTGTAKLTFDGETNSQSLKMKQSVNAESVILSYITIDASAVTETPFMKSSVIKVTGKAQMEGLKVELTASHNADLIGRVSGTVANTCDFLAQPFEISLDCKNKGNSKILLPLKLTAKIDLQNDYKLDLSCEKQHASWVAHTRFNQYKYNHALSLENNEKDAVMSVSVDGEANLDFLTVPLTVPEMTVPYFETKTPKITEFSLWEDLGLKDLLATPRQSVDIDFKLQYQKNPDKHTFDLDLHVSSNGGLYNQSDIVVKVGASSTSVFEFLKAKLDGTTSITKKRGLKVATSVSVEHNNAEYSHESTISLNRRNMEASVANNAKINLPIFTMEFNQVLAGNPKTKPNLSSKTKLQYSYNLPMMTSEGNGNLHHAFTLETLSSYLSLENSLRAKVDGAMLEIGSFSKALDNEASLYLNANGLRSTMKTDIKCKAEYKKNKIWSVDMTENFALDASLRRVYATLGYSSKNEINIASYSTNGAHSAQGTIEFVPLTTLTGNLNFDLSQSSDLGLARIAENVDIALTLDKQKFIWSGVEQLPFIKHASDLTMSNDEAEVRIESTESLEGRLAFLKSIRLPVYQRTLWDVLKFDEATSTDQQQFLNVSTNLVYTKNMEGTLFALPATVFENGVTFDIPEMTLAVPDWVKQIPQMIREMDQRLEHIDVPDYVSIPPVITIPTFDVPLTSLNVPSFTLDLQNLRIPKLISSPAFDVTVPGLPAVRVPQFNIDTEYMRDKMALLLLKLPQYEITISAFTLPKTFTIGKHTIKLDDITKAIYHFEMPTITIPEQKIEIPEISLPLPVSVFIPNFGALSTTVKVSSPIYNNTWTAQVENKEPGYEYTLKSACTSTLTFLAYDLDGKILYSFSPVYSLLYKYKPC
uniref:Apolipoprotein Ba n=1 Tax=Astyanax mexicanus TaxID=7994 RepID=A0A8B9KIY2_ASTMX